MAEVDAPDTWYLKAGLTAEALAAALVGRSFAAARRIGKLLLLDVDPGPERLGGGAAVSGVTGSEATGPVLGLRFGMTGRLLVDGAAGVEDLRYSSVRDEPAWDRFRLTFTDGGELRMRDPRRLGGVLIDPDESALGVDALAVSPGALRRLLASRAPLKARLMDQGRVAGVGNLIADEVLYRASLDPARPADGLGDAEVRRLARHLRTTLHDLMARGGAHTGDLQPFRTPGGRCPKDGAALARRTIGGRTTWSCPEHQR